VVETITVIEDLDIWLETAEISKLLDEEGGWNMRTIAIQVIKMGKRVWWSSTRL